MEQDNINEQANVNEQVQVSEEEIEKNKRFNKIVTIVCSIVGFIVAITLLNLTVPTLMGLLYGSIESGIRDLTGLYIDIDRNGSVGNAPTSADKPVIYVYGEEDNQDVKVKLSTSDDIVCEYPKRNEDGLWRLKADTNGKLTIDNKEYNYLFWESRYTDTNWDFSQGFCVKGSDSKEFLERTLEEVGLNRKEANEFIIYWLPKLEKNEYNLISFQDRLYKERYELEIEPYTSNVLRVFMTFKKVDGPVEIKKQDLSDIKGNFRREGLYIVEWGGSEIK